ncbi:MAG: phosphate/phosphite/phosphonate ABC transporter substrate-binding protein [Deltaproteobacteria bacterium]|nr:phosphate/phosphite/phosphonate ABC transporter substrate-binding protein [Deltaproteobacteria bacterium]
MNARLARRASGPATALWLALVGACPAFCPASPPGAAGSDRGVDAAVWSSSWLDVRWPERVKYGITPVLDRERLERGHQPLCDELGRILGTRVELVVADSYANLGERVARREIAVGQFSPLAWVEAKAAFPELRLVASMIAEGGADYAGYIVARAESDIMRADDLRGHSFGFVDRSSASGYLFPLVYLWDRYGDPQSFFSSIHFLGNHDELLRAVASGEVDAGATFSAALVNSGRAGLGSPFRIVAKTGRVPYDAMAAGPALNDSQARALQAALLSIDTRSPRGRRVLGPLRLANGFVPGDDRRYQPVRERLARAALFGASIVGAEAEPDAGR